MQGAELLERGGAQGAVVGGAVVGGAVVGAVVGGVVLGGAVVAVEAVVAVVGTASDDVVAPCRVLVVVVPYTWVWRGL